jgi:hypothetical protein
MEQLSAGCPFVHTIDYLLQIWTAVEDMFVLITVNYGEYKAALLNVNVPLGLFHDEKRHGAKAIGDC